MPPAEFWTKSKVKVRVFRRKNLSTSMIVILFLSNLSFLSVLSPALATGQTSEIPLPPSVVETSISAGGSHTCAVTLTGVVRCWGLNNFGQLNVPSDLGATSQVSAGYQHTCAVTLTGVVRCWGLNNVGQLNVPSDLGATSQVSAGNSNTCAIQISGSVKCWGDNSLSATFVPDNLEPAIHLSVGSDYACVVGISNYVSCWGNNENSANNVPADLMDVSTVSVGENAICALRLDKSLRCWGANVGRNVPADLGPVAQVSVGGFHTCAVTVIGETRCWSHSLRGWLNIPTSTLTSTPDGLGPVSQISASPRNTCAAKVSGTAVCWGDNSLLQSSVPDTIGALLRLTDFSPAQLEVNLDGDPVPGSTLDAIVTNVAPSTRLTFQWLRDGEPIVGAALDSYAVSQLDLDKYLSVRVSGTLSGHLPGANTSSQVLVTRGNLSLTPTPLVLGSFRAGSLLTVESGVWSPGVSLSYQWLRDGSAIAGASNTSYLLGAADFGRRISVSVTGVLQGYVSSVQTSTSSVVGASIPVVTGMHKVSYLLRVDPGVWDPGMSFSYQWLRDGTAIPGATNSEYLLQLTDFNTQVSVRVIASKSGITVANEVSTSVNVSLSSESAVFASVVGSSFGCVLFESRRVKCWGKNFNGELGNGTFEDSKSPVLVSGLSNAVSISSSSSHTCALLADESVVCWGYNRYGVLGDGTVQKRSTPVPVIGIANAVAISTSETSSCALLRDQTVKCWGVIADLNGPNLTPMTILGSDKAEMISVGNQISCAILVNKSVKCWGYNPRHNRLSAVFEVPGWSNVISITAGLRKVCGIFSDNSVECWESGAAPTGGGAKALKISFGINSSCTLLLSKKVTCAGENNWGQLGAELDLNGLSKDYLAELNQVVDIKVQGATVCATLQDKSLMCWGANFNDILATGNDSQKRPVKLALPSYLSSLTLTPTPKVSGSFKVGSLLTVEPSVWDSGVSLSYQWLRDGTPILGASNTSYPLVAADLGRSVSVSVTGVLEGFVSSTAISPSSIVGAGDFRFTPTPKVSGSFKVGSLLTVEPGVWDSGVSLSYQWLRDGKAIKTAIKGTLKLTSEDAGHKISVTVAGKKDGYTPRSLTSKQASVKLQKMIATKPQMTGQNLIGKVLSWKTKLWAAGAKPKFQWFLNGRTINGATRGSIKVLGAYRGKSLSLRVSQSAPGYESAYALSTNIKIK